MKTKVALTCICRLLISRECAGVSVADGTKGRMIPDSPNAQLCIQ